MPNYKVGLNTADIDNLIKELKKYQSRLDNVNDLFIERLAEHGIQTANYHIGQTKGLDEDKSTGDIKFIVDSRGIITSAEIEFSGEQVMFIEFGSGITYNKGGKHPSGMYGVGTYPNQKHAFNPKGWMYINDDGELTRSYGISMTAPMYNAGVEMARVVQKIAREVFGSVS